MFCYRELYGTDLTEFTSHRGEVFERNYLDFMEENGQLLWMQTFDGEMFDIRKFLDKWGVSYD